MSDPRKPPQTWYTHPEMDDSETVSRDTVDGFPLHARWVAPQDEGLAATLADARMKADYHRMWANRFRILTVVCLLTLVIFLAYVAFLTGSMR